MKIEFADSFFDSLRGLEKYNTWWYKLYKLFWRRIPCFFKNIYIHREGLWKQRPWESLCTLYFLKSSFYQMKEYTEKYGQEIDSSKMKKVAKMERAIELLNNILTEDYIAVAEEKLSTKINRDYIFADDYILGKIPPDIEKSNNIIRDHSREIEEAEWKELWDILRGTDPEDSHYEDWNGSDMRGWWS